MANKTDIVKQEDLVETLEFLNENPRFKLLNVVFNQGDNTFKVTYTWHVDPYLMSLGEYILTNPVVAYEGFAFGVREGTIIQPSYWSGKPIAFIKMLRKMTNCQLAQGNDVKRELWDKFGYTLPDYE